MTIFKQMKKYTPFVNDLKAIIASFSNNPDFQWKEKAISSINGLAGYELRTRISIEDRRASGAFFTDATLALEVLNSYKLTFGNKVVFYDPACGAGNLLISVKNQYETMLLQKQVELEVAGTDIHKEFVDATISRLKIYDLVNNKPTKDYIGNISVANGLLENSVYKNATHIITNPPFNQVNSQRDIEWASGKVSAAALFIDSIIKNVNIDVEIIAILPDVLRSGSRYNKWREYVSKNCIISNIKLLGQFDSYTDVDVFSVMLKKRAIINNEAHQDWHTTEVNSTNISNLFNISVGSVVDNRDPHEGIQRPYLVSKGLEGWKELSYTELKRKHKGKTTKAPFVVVKRTSRHGDNHRAIATLITIPEPVYVDNHLIVLKPKKGGIRMCKKLLKLLKSKNTDNWIDDQIRCRHLTVKIVSQIPFN